MVMLPYISIGKNTVYIIHPAFNGDRKPQDALLNNTFVERIGYI